MDHEVFGLVFFLGRHCEDRVKAQRKIVTFSEVDRLSQQSGIWLEAGFRLRPSMFISTRGVRGFGLLPSSRQF